MTNIVYKYPKSSCNCYKCTNTAYSCDTNGVPSNMSIGNCEIPSLFQCYDRESFRFDIEPRDKHGYNYLNPDVITDKYSSDFKSVECSGKQGCPKKQYASTDPRLISASHGGQVLTLDRPPIETQPRLNTIATDTKLNDYGKGYRTYSDINAGQIMYYVDKSIQDPFFEPNFTTSARAYGTLYRDPMGAFKPQYDREPLISPDHLNTMKDSYGGGLSWIKDSMEHREDLMARQSRKRNQERWEPRWEGLSGRLTCK